MELYRIDSRIELQPASGLKDFFDQFDYMDFLLFPYMLYNLVHHCRQHIYMWTVIVIHWLVIKLLKQVPRGGAAKLLGLHVEYKRKILLFLTMILKRKVKENCTMFSQYSAVAKYYMDYDAIFHEIFHIRLSYRNYT